MTAADIRWGRQGGRVIPWSARSDDRRPDTLFACACGRRWWGHAGEVDPRCLLDGGLLRRVSGSR